MSLNSGMPDSFAYLEIQSYILRMTITLSLGSLFTFIGAIFIVLTAKGNSKPSVTLA